MEEENDDTSYFDRCQYCNEEFKSEDKTFCTICTRKLRNEVYGSTDEFHLSDEELSQMFIDIFGRWRDNRVTISSCSNCCYYCSECKQILCYKCTGQNYGYIIKDDGFQYMICGFCRTEKAATGAVKLNMLLNKALIRATPSVYKPLEGSIYMNLKNKWDEHTNAL